MRSKMYLLCGKSVRWCVGWFDFGTTTTKKIYSMEKKNVHFAIRLQNGVVVFFPFFSLHDDRQNFVGAAKLKLCIKTIWRLAIESRVFLSQTVCFVGRQYLHFVINSYAWNLFQNKKMRQNEGKNRCPGNVSYFLRTQETNFFVLFLLIEMKKRRVEGKGEHVSTFVWDQSIYYPNKLIMTSKPVTSKLTQTLTALDFIHNPEWIRYERHLYAPFVFFFAGKDNAYLVYNVSLTKKK